MLVRCDTAHFLSRTGNRGFITEVIQTDEIVATVRLHLPRNLLYVELTVMNYWTFGLNRLTFLSFEILKVIESETGVDFKSYSHIPN